MRGKASHSMYQQGVVNNKSIAVSKLMGNSLVDGLSGKSMLANNKSTRKVEGHDLGRTAKSNFEQTVHNLKSKPNQKVLEDEYINVPMIVVRVSKNKSNIWSMNSNCSKINRYWKERE